MPATNRFVSASTSFDFWAIIWNSRSTWASLSAVASLALLVISVSAAICLARIGSR